MVWIIQDIMWHLVHTLMRINGGVIIIQHIKGMMIMPTAPTLFPNVCSKAAYQKMTKTWYNKKILGFYKISSAWGKANDLYHWLKNGKYIKRQIIVKNKKELSDCVKKYLYGKSWCIATIFFDWENDGKIDHATLSGQTTCKNGLYDLYYFAHSSMRNGRMTKYYPRYGNPYYSPVSATFKKIVELIFAC